MSINFIRLPILARMRGSADDANSIFVKLSTSDESCFLLLRKSIIIAFQHKEIKGVRSTSVFGFSLVEENR